MILVTGVNGQLGYDVVKELNSRNIECKGIDIEDLDIINKNDVALYIEKLKPCAVIHCAAYTAVDKAEDDVDNCSGVNVTGTRNIAEACKKIDAKMIYISTDYVFSGEGDTAFDINDNTSPIGIYGKTKLEGENVVLSNLEKYFIVRISWVFGINGNNFVKTMLKLGKEKNELNVIDDQIGSPTYTADLSKLLCDMVQTEKYGVYHATNEGYCSWADFAMAIMEKANLDCKINKIPTSQYPTRARRPLNSRMSKKSLDNAGFMRLSSWEKALDDYLLDVNHKID